MNQSCMEDLCVIIIEAGVKIDEKEINESFIHSSGPGGQNVNKVATAVQLRFDVKSSGSIPEEVKKRLIRLAGKKITDNGVLLIEAKRFRSQERNRQDARERLAGLLKRALKRPRKRKQTRPPASSKRKRLDNKRHRSALKKTRNLPSVEPC